jgi:hypothetical protein
VSVAKLRAKVLSWGRPGSEAFPEDVDELIEAVRAESAHEALDAAERKFEATHGRGHLFTALIREVRDTFTKVPR